MAKPETARLPQLRRTITRELEALPKFDYDKRTAYDRAVDAMELRLEALGAVIKTDFRGCRVRLAGISAHSTSGLVSALHNWHAGAGRALDRETLEGMGNG